MTDQAIPPPRATRRVLLPLLSLAIVAGVVVPFAGASAQGPTVTFTYKPITRMPFGTTEGESTVLGGKLYMFGGFDATRPNPCCRPTSRALRYDPATDTWKFLATMPENGISHAGIDSDGKRYIYYAGGYAANASYTGQVFGTTHGFRYDTVTNTYSRLPDLPQARAAGGLAYVGGKLYYFGGANAARTYDAVDVWSLDVAHHATRWVTRASMPNGRNHLGWGVIGGKIYAVGGQHHTSGSEPQSDLDVYDPATNRWRVLAPMPFPRSHEMDSTTVISGRLVVAGGNIGTGNTASVIAYNPVTNRWDTWSNLPEQRTSTTVRGLAGSRFIFCCGSAPGNAAQTGWLATAKAPIPVPRVVVPAPRVTALRLAPARPHRAQVGRAVLTVRMTRAAPTTVVLQRCTSANRCRSLVVRRTVSLRAGTSHVTLRSLLRRAALPRATYRLALTPRGGKTAALRMVVRR